MVDNWRALELARLEELHCAWWSTALALDPHAAAIVLKTAERRAKLLGLDVLVRSEQAPTEIHVRWEGAE